MQYVRDKNILYSSSTKSFCNASGGLKLNTAKNWIKILSLPLFTLSAHASEDCPGLARMEIAGKYTAPSTISWQHEEVPNRFIFDIKSIRKSDKGGILNVAKKYSFLEPDRIVSYTIDDDSRAGVVYRTEIGDIFHSKILMKIMNGHSCTPGTSINIDIDGLPAALTYLSGEKNKRNCMWNLEIIGLRDAVRYSFHYPVNCMQIPNIEDATKMLSVMKALMPASAFKK